MREYTNHGQKEIDETLIKVHKSSSRSQGNCYNFSTTKGVNWGIGGNIGAKVMALDMPGIDGSISANYGKTNKSTHLRTGRKDICAYWDMS